MLYRIPYALMLPVLVPPTGTDGFGNPVTGYQEPLFDTLLGIANPSEVLDLNVTLRVYGQDGVIISWPSGGTSRSITLAARHSIAMSFIDPNPLTGIPQNWEGYMTIQTDNPCPIFVLLGGAGYFPLHWNEYSVTVPIYADNSSDFDVPILRARSDFHFPYLIPFFQDLNHNAGLSYRALLVLTNFDSLTVYAHVTYRIGDYYAGVGTTYTWVETLTAGQQTKLDMYTKLQTLGYVAGTNSEGWMQITLRATTDPASAKSSALFAPFLINRNADANRFSAGEQFQ